MTGRLWRFRALDTALGLVVGFTLGYALQERLAQVQPPPKRLPSSQAGVNEPGTRAGTPDAARVNPMAAIEELRAALERNPNDTEALRVLANLNLEIQRWSRAEELYRRYLALRPGDADARTDLGVTLRAQGRTEDALKEFQAVREADPHHWQARFHEILVLAFDQGQLEAAEAKLAELERLAPGEPAVRQLAEELKARRFASS